MTPGVTYLPVIRGPHQYSYCDISSTPLQLPVTLALWASVSVAAMPDGSTTKCCVQGQSTISLGGRNDMRTTTGGKWRAVMSFGIMRQEVPVLCQNDDEAISAGSSDYRVSSVLSDVSLKHVENMPFWNVNNQTSHGVEAEITFDTFDKSVASNVSCHLQVVLVFSNPFSLTRTGWAVTALI